MNKRILCVQGIDGHLHVDRKALNRHQHDYQAEWSGAYHFSGGVCWDDVKLEYRCRTCGKLMPKSATKVIMCVNDPITI
jgi:hypothetical protein